MSGDDHEAENVLLGSILRNDEDDYEEVFSNNHSPLRNQILESDSIIENVSNYEQNYFDSFNRSFEQMSLGSDQACSPTSGKHAYAPHYPTKIHAIRSEERHSNSMSFDGQSFSTQENSIHYKPTHGYVNPQQKRMHDYQMTYSPGIQRTQPLYPTGYNYQKMTNVSTFNGLQKERLPYYEITDDIQLSNDLDNMCGNQILSRKVQKIFENGKQDQKDLIFNKVERSCIQFSKDVFGNYVMQKIFERGSQSQQKRLFNKIKPHIYELSKNNFGCRVVQKMIEIIQNDDNFQNEFLDATISQIKSLLYDASGNYVILKCLETFPKDKVVSFLQPIEESTLFLCSSQYGCKIILKALDLYPSNLTDKIMKTCLSHQHSLCLQEFGNHILQFAIKQPQYSPYVVNFVLLNFERLCMNKYASNTVEKVVEASTNEVKIAIISILIQLSPLNGINTFVNISINPFGNYVMKKLLIMSNPSILQPLIDILRRDPNLIIYIRSSEFGQRIYQLIEKTLLMLKP